MIINKFDDIFIVHILKKYLDNINIFDVKMMISFFKKVLSKIKKKYYINGLCYISVYYDENYGMILEIDSFDNGIMELDVNIKFYFDSIFMIEIDSDVYDEYDNIYYYDGKYYTYYIKNSDSTIIYKDTLNIIFNGLKVK